MLCVYLYLDSVCAVLNVMFQRFMQKLVENWNELILSNSPLPMIDGALFNNVLICVCFMIPPPYKIGVESKKV